MPYKQQRVCPICGSYTLNLSDHLCKVHGLNMEERQPYLQMATQRLIEEPCSIERPSKRPLESLPKDTALTDAYPEFYFKHPFSMLVVGPTQSGKTYFVEQMLTSPHLMEFPSRKKDVKVTWFYNQWQPRYQKLEKVLGQRITFQQGLPNWSDDLREINPKSHHVLVFDDLMRQAVDSPILSRLFTQGRHRNASVILLMQNMFPKGKYNTDISRNAQYLVLFRSPSDRKQVNIIAERIFAKDRSRFMQVYTKATQVPYGYVLIDNQPCTAPEYQVVTDVFGECQRHPILGTSQPPMKPLCEERVNRQKVVKIAVKKPKTQFYVREPEVLEENSDVESFEDFSESEQSKESEPGSELEDFEKPTTKKQKGERQTQVLKIVAKKPPPRKSRQTVSELEDQSEPEVFENSEEELQEEQPESEPENFEEESDELDEETHSLLNTMTKEELKAALQQYRTPNYEKSDLLQEETVVSPDSLNALATKSQTLFGPQGF